MWVKDCEEGSMVVETFKNMHWRGCEALCQYNQQCKTYLYDEDSLNCALTSATEGTSLANGISGPDLPHKKPPLNRGRRKPALGTEDCSEFHFRDCSQEGILEEDLEKDSVYIKGTNWQTEKGRRDVWQCNEFCKGANLQETCASFAFVPDDFKECGKNGVNQKGAGCFGRCGAHEERNVKDFIQKSCNVVSGRVGDQYTDDKDKFESCKLIDANDLSEINPCRRGYCDLEHYGAPIDHDKLADETACKYSCYGYLKGSGKHCTHYEYNRQSGKCDYFQVDTTKSVQYSCWMHAGPKELAPQPNTSTATNPNLINDLNTCVQDVITIGDGGGGNTTEGPGSISTTAKNPGYTSLTTPRTTTIDCRSERLDIALLFDDSESIFSEGKREQVMVWMKKLLNMYGIDGVQRRAALMQWSDRIGEVIDFDERLDEQELSQRIDNIIDPLRGGTHGDEALDAAFQRFFHGSGDPEVWQAVIFLTDGVESPGSEIIKSSLPYHANQIRLTAVYIGEGEPPQELRQILGEGQTKGYTNRLFQPRDLDHLTSEQFVQKVSGCGPSPINRNKPSYYK